MIRPDLASSHGPAARHARAAGHRRGVLHGPAGSLAAIAVLSLLAGCGGRSSSSPFDEDRAWEHVETMVGFGPRPAGSEAMERQADWLIGELKAIGLSPVEQTFTEDTRGRKHEVDGEPIVFRNVHAVVPGSDPENGPFVVLGAHYDTKLTHGHDEDAHNFEFVGAIDGAGASAVMLELARVLAARNRELLADPNLDRKLPNLWFVWFDGEESLAFDWDDERALFGSRHFVAELAGEGGVGTGRIGAMVLADLIGDKDIKIDRDVNSSKPLQDLFLDTAREMGEGARMYRYKSQFKDDHIPFHERGIPSLVLIDFQYRIPGQRRANEPPEIADLQAWWHTPQDTIDKMSPEALGFAGDLIYNTLPKIEQSKRVQRKFPDE